MFNNLAEENAKLAISSKLVQMQWSNSIAALLVVNEKEKLVIYDMNLKQKAEYRDPVTAASWSADGTQIAPMEIFVFWIPKIYLKYPLYLDQRNYRMVIISIGRKLNCILLALKK